MSAQPLTTMRRFLTRQEATYLLGLMDASQPVQPKLPVTVAIRTTDGNVHEAEAKERLHANIVLRVRPNQWTDGWTISEADYQAIVAEARAALAQARGEGV